MFLFGFLAVLAAHPIFVSVISTAQADSDAKQGADEAAPASSHACF